MAVFDCVAALGRLESIGGGLTLLILDAVDAVAGVTIEFVDVADGA